MTILLALTVLSAPIVQSVPQPSEDTETGDARPSRLTEEQEQHLSQFTEECGTEVEVGVIYLELEAARFHTWVRYTKKTPDGKVAAISREEYLIRMTYSCALDRSKKDPLFQFRGKLKPGETFV